MEDIQALAVSCRSGVISHNAFLEGCKPLIKALAGMWYNKIGTYDGRDFDEKEHLCSIWCWEAIVNYDDQKGRFTTFYYRHGRNRIKNLIQKRNRHNEVANSYDRCISYEFNIEGDLDSTGENRSPLYGEKFSIEDGYTAIDIEILLKDGGFNDTTIEIVKYKMDKPKMSCAAISEKIGISRAYVSILWNRVTPYLIKELCALG